MHARPMRGTYHGLAETVVNIFASGMRGAERLGGKTSAVGKQAVAPHTGA